MRLSLSNRAINTLIAHATEGYEIDYKKEVGGHLLGFRDEDSFYVSRAVPYDTPLGSRTWWGPNLDSLKRKGRRLETTRLKWIGIYHSHLGGSTLLSKEDKKALKYSGRPIEIITRVSNCLLKTRRDCLSYQENDYFEENGYSWDICGYVIDSREKIKRIKVVKAR